MIYDEYNEDLDIEEEKSNIITNMSFFTRSLTCSDWYKSFRDLMIFPDIFFKKIFSNPLKLKIPFLIIILLCILNIPYKMIFDPKITLIANPFGIIGEICILYGPLRTINGINFLSFGVNDPISFLIYLLNGIFLIIYPLYNVIILTLFFLFILHYYANISFSHFKQTFIWVTYGSVPLIISWIIFELKDIIMNPFQTAIKVHFMDVNFNYLFSYDHNFIDTIYTIFTISIFPFIDLILGILFLYWCAKIWNSGLAVSENLSAKKRRNVIFFAVGIMICLQIIPFILGVIWRYNWFYHSL